MSKREDILDGSLAANSVYGLVYTCNFGWLDLGHMNPKSKRAHTGAETLWREINAGGPDVRQCLGSHPQLCTLPSRANAYPLVTFPDKISTGFRVVHVQEMFALGNRISSGVKREYIVRHNLSVAEKKSVALAIFMEVSLEFEAHQELFPKFVTDSGFSQEDLVSNLIGFHIGVGTVTLAEVIAMAKPVSKETALAIWDRNGAVGSHKNRGFKPMYSPDTFMLSDKSCIDECRGIVPRAPVFFEKIKPAKKGELFMNNMLGGI
ncbi:MULTISPECIES: hypothetical protein [Delftia]|jgi:hypothetical protein|uniref:hypothetical protein n=1 Tax=Delftia TaxID=80865 RepID=UPI000A41889C|nr:MULTISPECIES: hypothetical protein [Delftia]MBS3720406.1 hypothetical protein [Delftia sp. PE138]